MEKHRNMTIKNKLVLSFLILSAVSFVLALIGIISMQDSRQAESQMQMRIESLPIVSDVEQDTLSIQSAANAAVLNAKNQEEYSSLSKSVDGCIQAYKAAHEKLMATVQTAEWKTKLTNARKSYDSDYEPKIREALQYAQSGSTEQASQSLKAASTADDAILKTYTAFMDYRVTVAQSVYSSDQAHALTLLVILLVVAVAGIAVSAFIAMKMTKAITKPLNELSNCAVELSKGNLKTRADYKSKDEFGTLASALNSSFDSLQRVVTEISDLLQGMAAGRYDYESVQAYDGDFQPISESANTILDELNQIFGDTWVSADQVGGGSQQVADGAQALAQGATEQASSVEELSASITDVSAKVKQNSRNITEIAADVKIASSEAGTGNEQMQKMLVAMNEISTASEEIAKIIKVIDNIAFQTNILALNASVEAAHAGEAGKGFAIVAEEVRSLASKSADAAKQTAALIGNSVSKVKEGRDLADSTAQTLTGIAEKVQAIDATIQQIEAASNAQATAIAQITQGIDQVSAVIQTNSATAEESAAASEELSAQAKQLKKDLDKIQLRRQN